MALATVLSARRSRPGRLVTRPPPPFAVTDTLRWIYVHIIREHARHVGHAGIIREQIDGATGD
jgi:Protein of unknown function (DUF664)